MKNTTWLTIILALLTIGISTGFKIFIILTIASTVLFILRYKKAIPELGKGEHGQIRQKIKKYIKHKQKGRCGHPGCQEKQYLKLHHIVPKWMGGDNRVSNLIYLCPNHEAKVHDGGNGKVNYQAIPCYLRGAYR